NVQEHEKVLTKAAMAKLQQVDKLAIYGPEEAKRGGLVSFNIGVHPHDVSALLDAEGIAVRGGHHCAMPLASLLGLTGSVRASFYIYNTIEEIDRFADALENVANKMKKFKVVAVAEKSRVRQK
ncbi:MAG TPA: aminotransferase class V-fold PLP-dependent enzyme, partial [Candidatus Nanoarchaeia archaeon]|nr:aminotransferase class V-fold PLP-dependent enzyme [Candidatus Nanoarchaeia archaeon]